MDFVAIGIRMDNRLPKSPWKRAGKWLRSFLGTRWTILGEFVLEHGNGIIKRWYDNGILASENSVVNGMPCGLMKVWDESGAFMGGTFWIHGKKVSKKKYLEAARENPSLPQYEGR